MRETIAIALASVALTMGPAQGQTAGAKAGEPAELILSGPTRIHAFAFAQDGKGVYLQDSRRVWFYASFVPPCYAADVAVNVVLRPFAEGNRLIEGDTIVAGPTACEIDTLVRSGAPPTHPRRVFRPRWSMGPNRHLGPGWR